MIMIIIVTSIIVVVKFAVSMQARQPSAASSASHHRTIIISIIVVSGGLASSPSSSSSSCVFFPVHGLTSSPPYHHHQHGHEHRHRACGSLFGPCKPTFLDNRLQQTTCPLYGRATPRNNGLIGERNFLHRAAMGSEKKCGTFGFQ